MTVCTVFGPFAKYSLQFTREQIKFVQLKCKIMSKKKQTGSQKNARPKVHKDLDGFDIKINSFGEIVTSFDMDKINEFLNKNVDDKKLRDRDDVPGRDDFPDEAIIGEDDDEDLDIDIETDDEDDL